MSELYVEVTPYTELKVSNPVNGELGIFCKKHLEADKFLGTYQGKIRKSISHCTDPDYVWMILSSRNAPIHYIDATDPRDSNWLRFIRWTPDASKYNVICMQQNQQINYFTFKKIKPGEELLTYLPSKKKPQIKNKSKQVMYSIKCQNNQVYTLAVVNNDNTNDNTKSTNNYSNDTNKQKRDRSLENGRSTNNSKKKFGKNNSSITPLKMKQQQSDDQEQTHDGPTTRSRNLRKIKSDNLTHKISNQNSHNHKNSNRIVSKSPTKALKSTTSNKILKKFVNKKTEFKCTICSYKDISWFNVKLHLYKTHINSKYSRINNKNRKKILKLLNKKILYRKTSKYIENECKLVLDNIIDRIENNNKFNVCASVDNNENDFNKYCLYKCHICVENCFVYKNQLRKHLKKFHANDVLEMDVDNDDDDEEEEDEEDDDDDGEDEGEIEDDEQYSGSDYDTDVEACLEKKLVESKILDDESEIIEIEVDNDVNIEFEDVNENDDDVVDEQDVDFNVESSNNNNNDDELGGDDLGNLKTSRTKNAKNKITTTKNDNVFEEETRDGLADNDNRKGKYLKEDNFNADLDTNANDATNTNGDDETQATSSGTTTNSTTTPNETNDDDVAKFTCNLCKKQFEDRLTLTKHQRSEMSLKMLKKKKELRKKKWRDIHWKRKIDLSYIETTQLNNLSQNIADNLSFCIDGTQEDLKSYNKETKDYLLTELGQESDLQMFLKCFPDLYESIISEQLQLQFMDINLTRKANSYFANCYYSPVVKENVQQPNSSKLTSSQAICSVYHCKNCRLKFKNLADLIQHQRFTHNLNLKTTFDSYNYDYDQDTDVDLRQQPPPTLTQKEKMLNSSPIGYLRCDPYAYILNLYWDNTEMKKCLKCNNTFLRRVYKKHVETCGLELNESQENNNEANLSSENVDNNAAKIIVVESDASENANNNMEIQNNEEIINVDEMINDQVKEIEIIPKKEIEEAVEVVQVVNEEPEIENKETTSQVEVVEEAKELVVENEIENTSTVTNEIQVKEQDVENKTEPVEDIEEKVESKEEVKADEPKQESYEQQQQQQPTHQHETRSRKRSLRLIDDLNTNNLRNKRQVVKSSYASEHFVYFGTNGTNSSYRKSLQNSLHNEYYEMHQQKSRQITATVASTSKKAKPNNAEISTANDDSIINSDQKLNTITQQTLPQTSPSLLVSALNSCDSENKAKVSKRGKKKQPEQLEQIITKDEIKDDLKEDNSKKRTSKRIKKESVKKVEAELDTSLNTKSSATTESLAQTTSNIGTSSATGNELDFQIINEKILTSIPVTSNCNSNSSSNKTSTSNLSQIVNTPQSDSTIKHLAETTSNSTSANTSFIEYESNFGENEVKQNRYQISKYEHVCEKCGLGFTSANSVTRHQEKSCLRIHIVNLEDNAIKCPICGKLCPTTHQMSIHISKYHGSLLGSSALPPSEEARKLYEQHINNSTTEPINETENSEKSRIRKKKLVDNDIEVATSPSASSIITEDTKPNKALKKRSYSLTSSKSVVQKENDVKKRKISKRNNSANSGDFTVTSVPNDDVNETSEANGGTKKIPKLKIKKSTSLSPTVITKKPKIKLTPKIKSKKLSLDNENVENKKRKYNRKTIDNSELENDDSTVAAISASLANKYFKNNEKTRFKCDYCEAVFKSRTKQINHMNICKSKLNDTNEKSNDEVTIAKLFNDELVEKENNSEGGDKEEIEENEQMELQENHHQLQQQEYKSNLNEDEFIIHNDDDDDDNIVSPHNVMVNDIVYNK